MAPTDDGNTEERLSGPKSYLDVMKPEDINIAHLWTQFAGFVLDPGAPEMQRSEIRKAFFAGFLECFKLFDDLSNGLPEAMAVAHLDRLSKESRAFFEAMMKEHGPR